MKNKSRFLETLFLATLMCGTMIFTLTPLQLVSAATTSTVSATSDISHPQRTELYRPQYHFSPQKNWMNDPNGLVYYDGEYHLFFQYHPYGDTWGPMHWGHAISKNLVDWDEYPIAIFQDTEGMIFSGSAVVDWNNTSGLQTGNEKVMVAMFTQSTPNNTQEQGIAYSNDRGRTWVKYAGNPVLPNISPDFRDPKVFWHEQTKQWVMILTLGNKVAIYNSPNLKQWTKVSEFGDGQGSQGRPWECPDLFPLSVDGGATQKWVMLVSVQSAAPAGGSGAQYFVGDFDGKNFKNLNPADKILWLDYGKDNYAGVSFSDIPASDGRRIYMGWMSNWEYAQSAPTSPWRSSNTVPRSLQLKTFSDGIRLVQTPVTELQALRQSGTTLPTQTITPGTNPLSNLSGKQYEVVAEFNVDESCTASEFGFKIRKGGSNYTKLYYSKSNSEMGIDRSASGIFATGIQKAPLAPQNGKIKMRFLVDWSSVELFGNDGRETITDQIFTDAANEGLELYSQGGNVTLNSLQFYPLNSASIGKYEPQVNWPNGSFTNHDFETGDLTGWTTIGDAFNVNDVTDLMTPKGGSGDSFGDKEGKYHVWGYKDGLDATVGEMRSNPFVLGGDGKIDFRIGGGVDIDNLYVALVRRSDDKELLKATANKWLNPSTNQLEISEKLQKVTWDASPYIGQECYIKVVDKAAGGWGHINVDDFNVPVGTVGTPTIL
ncbi:glycoside hydrolase family 32 protein, partial [Clostridium sp. Maddingley MBC34-26]